MSAEMSRNERMEAAAARGVTLPAEDRVTVTPAAVAHLRRMLAKSPRAIGVRLGVKRSGCSGWSYDVGLTEEVGEEDVWFAVEGERWGVVVPSEALPLVRGTRIDLAGEGLMRRLVFANPNARGECGCGGSFAV
ncbi:MAG: iron-sulfur cluster assembly accessory protein [Hydrogenophilus sp.]|nr:iron-sulfur cluster assembly accessory protein [Hydrogenophilus sp.]